MYQRRITLIPIKIDCSLRYKLQNNMIDNPTFNAFKFNSKKVLYFVPLPRQDLIGKKISLKSD